MTTQKELISNLSDLLKREDVPLDVHDKIKSVVGDMRNPLSFDTWIYRAVVIVLGTTVLCTVIGGLLLTYLGKGDVKMTVPDAIVAIGSAAVGALAGLLAPSPRAE